MSINLKKYQKRCSDRMSGYFNELCEYEEKGSMLIHSCTGSGKTVMIADTLKQIENSKQNMLWFFIAPYTLHEQGYRFISEYLEKTSYTILKKEEVFSNIVSPNTIIFINWQSINRKDSSNIFISENENGNSLQQILEYTKSNNIKTGLIIDESHRNVKSNNSKQIIDTINPFITYYITATPDDKVKCLEAYTISRKNVVEEGMVKESCKLNYYTDATNDTEFPADIYQVRQGFFKRKHLEDLLKKEGSNVIPCMVIVLPNKFRKTEDATTERITTMKNVLIGLGAKPEEFQVWLSKEGFKSELDKTKFSNNTDNRKYLFVKQAWMEGWDCPRIHTIVFLKDIKSKIQIEQGLGRGCRLPEHKKYTHDDLNFLWAYTDAPSTANLIEEAFSYNVQEIIGTANKCDNTPNISLPMIPFFGRSYNDITAEVFYPLIKKEFHKTKEKLSKNTNVLGSVFSNETIEFDKSKRNISGINDKELLQSNTSIEFEYHKFCAGLTDPFSKCRSTQVIKIGLEKVVRKTLKLKNGDMLIAKKIILNNKEIIRKIVQKIKDEIPKKQKIVDENKERKVEIFYNIPEQETYTESYESVSEYNFTMLSPVFLQKRRSEPERHFERYLELKKILWHKNGDNGNKNFSIVYHRNDRKYKFYPDFLIYLKEHKKLYILDTKCDRDPAVKEKAETLYEYCKTLRQDTGEKIYSGIIQYEESSDTWYINEGKEYFDFKSKKNWVSLSF